MNLNSSPSLNCPNVSLLQPFNTIRNFYRIYLSETCLDLSIVIDDKSLNIDGNTLPRANYPSNTQQGVVCLYYRESLSIKKKKISQLPECLVFEVSFQNIKGYIFLYSLENQSLKILQ